MCGRSHQQENIPVKNFVSKKNVVSFVCGLLLMAFVGLASPQVAQGQSPPPIFVSPTVLYRFQISPYDGGYFYTPSYQAGINAGYRFQGAMPDGAGGIVGIYSAPQGYTPDPAVGLTPLYQWTVVESGWRVYYHYSIYLNWNPPRNYTFNGIVGYVFPAAKNTHIYHFPGREPFGVTLGKVSAWYSQPYGYWYGGGMIGNGYTFEVRPHSSYYYHGAIMSTPKAVTGTAPNVCQTCAIEHSYDVLFFPPPPPPSCDPNLANDCANNGGGWNPNTCECHYIEPPPDGGCMDCPPILQRGAQEKPTADMPPKN
jgi:hypothetical protein